MRRSTTTRSSTSSSTRAATPRNRAGRRSRRTPSGRRSPTNRRSTARSSPASSRSSWTRRITPRSNKLNPPPGAREGAHRVIFIDLARALAVVMMIYGHTVSALLASEYRAGPWYDAWTFQRGLTSSLFMLLAGFAFSIATTRHWATHTQFSPALWKRLRRFGLFVLLGYALHFPVSKLWHVWFMSGERWRSLLQVDVLQLIGVTFIAVQLIVLAVRSRRAFMVAALVLAAAIVAATPAVWSVDWESRLPLAVAAYLAPPPTSQFPLFPWVAFVLIGA